MPPVRLRGRRSVRRDPRAGRTARRVLHPTLLGTDGHRRARRPPCRVPASHRHRFRRRWRVPRVCQFLERPGRSNHAPRNARSRPRDGGRPALVPWARHRRVGVLPSRRDVAATLRLGIGAFSRTCATRERGTSPIRRARRSAWTTPTPLRRVLRPGARGALRPAPRRSLRADRGLELRVLTALSQPTWSTGASSSWC